MICSRPVAYMDAARESRWQITQWGSASTESKHGPSRLTNFSVRSFFFSLIPAFSRPLSHSHSLSHHHHHHHHHHHSVSNSFRPLLSPCGKALRMATEKIRRREEIWVAEGDSKRQHRWRRQIQFMLRLAEHGHGDVEIVYRDGRRKDSDNERK